MSTSRSIYKDTDLLTWVGGGAYKTIEAFVDEGLSQGCSRRLPGRPDWIKPGDTRVYLAHKDDRKKDAYGVLFGFYTIHSIHIIYDDIECGRKIKYRTCQPVLRPGISYPRDVNEFTDYITKQKIVIVRREEVKVRRKKEKADPLVELLEKLFKEWLEQALERIIFKDGNRYIPLSVEPDNLERLCGGASNLCSGRFNGAYASDDLGDWLLDKILEWLLEQPELPDEYFWEETVVRDVVTRKRRKQKRTSPGISRSRRVSLEMLHELYGEPPGNLCGLVVFEKPYPLYYHPPEAAFRGFQRIDGNSLLLKVNLPQYLK